MTLHTRRRNTLLHITLFSLGLLALITPGFGQAMETEEPSEFRKALTGGRAWARLRYRAEAVDQDPFTQDAFASTLRTVLGYETASFKGFKALIEFEDVAPIGNDRNYNSTTNGVVNRPVVAEPDGTEVNQVYLSYKLSEDALISVGRRQIEFGNARFLGLTGWRQNQQSFDSVYLRHEGIPNTKIQYAFLHGINRPTGENNPTGRERSRSHVLDIRHELEGIGELAAYALLLDFDFSKASNTNTYGIRLAGRQELSEDLDLLYVAEAAEQRDGDGNTGSVDANYHRVELGVDLSGFVVNLVQENLGNSGSAAPGFSTPLARRHRHNGWADLFFNTPASGFEDNFVSISKMLGPVNCTAVYHQFSPDSGSGDLGGEIDLIATYPITKQLTIAAKYANFNRDAAAPATLQDTERVMAWISYSVL